MIGKVRRAMSNRCNNTQRLGAIVAVAATVLFVAPAVAAEGDTSRATHIIDSSTDRTPRKTSFPKYPRIARRDRIQGDATVCFRVDLKGRIRSVRVKEYSDRIFRRPVLRAIKDSSFEPLKPDEVLSTERTCRTYRFRLEPIVAAGETE